MKIAEVETNFVKRYDLTVKNSQENIHMVTVDDQITEEGDIEIVDHVSISDKKEK